MGMRVIYCGELDRTPDALDHLGIRQGLEWLKGDGTILEYKIVDPLMLGKDEALRQIIEFNPDVTIHGNTDTLNLGHLQPLKGVGRQVFWMLDYQPISALPLYHGWWDEWTKCRGLLDAIFLSNYDQLTMWADGFGCDAHFLSHGCVVQDLVYNKEDNYSCVFIGGMNESGWYGERAKLLQEIGGFTHINEQDVEGRNRIWKRMPSIYHSSTCVLDVSHEWNARGYASGRYFYSAGLGACTITKRFPGCEEFYQDKEHKLYFDTTFEARNLIDWCQKNPNAVAQIKMNAWHHNKNEHNYKKRFIKMFSYL